MSSPQVNSFRLIPELRAKIASILIEQNISVIEVLCTEEGTCTFDVEGNRSYEFGHHYYLARGIQRHIDKPIVIKIRIDNPSDPQDIYYRDKNFDIERKFYLFAKDITNLVPRLVCEGSNNELRWLIYEFVPGTSLGPTFQVSRSVEADHSVLLANSLIELATTALPIELNLTIRNARSHFERLNKIIDQNAKYIGRYISQDQQRQIGELNLQVSPELDKLAHYLCHGDFHPGNIIIEGSKISIIDWETIHIDNYLFDASLLWLRLWNVPWRDRMLKLFLKNFPETISIPLLRHMILRHLIGEIVFWDRVISENNPNFIDYSQSALMTHLETLRKVLVDEDILPDGD